MGRSVNNVTSSPEKPASSAQRKRAGGVVVPHAPLWYQRLAAWLVFVSIRAVSATLRYRWLDHREAGPVGPVIYATWHNRLVLCLIGYAYARKNNPTLGLAAMVSASKDGALLSGVLECFGVQPVRGSSSRRGPQALLELTTWAERGYDLALTPDGPRGPCYVVQEGVMSLAQITGLQIIPFSYSLKWKIQAKSWDRFQIPLPFSRCEMAFGKPVRVPREATEAQRETLRQELERTMRGMAGD
jgi:lysophospholipid acyltransferase (LPLAT)-like uncharacterized protein